MTPHEGLGSILAEFHGCLEPARQLPVVALGVVALGAGVLGAEVPGLGVFGAAGAFWIACATFWTAEPYVPSRAPFLIVWASATSWPAGAPASVHRSCRSLAGRRRNAAGKRLATARAAAWACGPYWAVPSCRMTTARALRRAARSVCWVFAGADAEGDGDAVEFAAGTTRAAGWAASFCGWRASRATAMPPPARRAAASAEAAPAFQRRPVLFRCGASQGPSVLSSMACPFSRVLPEGPPGSGSIFPTHGKGPCSANVRGL